MQRELLLLRHGKSDWRQAVADLERPLKHRGERNATQVGAWLRANDLLPDIIISSPATRAVDTARRVRVAGAWEDLPMRTDERIYAAELEDLLAVIADLPAGTARVLLVGHNPGLEELLVYLAGPQVDTPADGKLLPTATLARLRMPGSWRKLNPGSGRLLGITRPGDIVLPG